MDDRTTRLESTVEQLRLDILALQQRLDALEATRPAAATTPGAAAAETQTGAMPDLATADAAARDQYDPIAILSLMGRLFLVIAGGFFLRAMTEAGALPQNVGLSLAFVYAAAWLFMTDRAGGRRQVPSAVFHAMAAAMISFPLLVEATTRFKVLTGVSSSLVLVVLTTGLLLVAWHRRLRAVAWITVIGALPVSLVLAVQTGVIPPYAAYLCVLGAVTLWMAHALGWWGLRWPVALVANLAVAGVTLRAGAAGHQDAPQVAMLLQLLLVAIYVLSVAFRTLVRDRGVTPFDVAQTAAALVVGLGGAVYLTQASGAVPAALGIASAVFGAACYGVAVTVVARRADNATNLHFYTTLALVLVLVGLGFVLGGQAFGAACALLAVLAAGSWSRSGRLFMLLHGVVYLLAAGIASGTLAYCARALTAVGDGPWELPDTFMLIVLVAAALSAGLAAMRSLPGDEATVVGPRFALVVLLVLAATGCLIGYLAPVFGGLEERSVDAGVLATVRTVVLALATLVVAWIGRHARFREWAWLVYPLLIAIGLKMMVQDFKYSRPATLFIAMAVFGAALIVAPRLRRSGRKAVPQASG